MSIPSLKAKSSKLKAADGFTLIEIMTVVAIMIILSVVAFINLNNRRSSADLTSSSQDIEALLREAQSRSVSGSAGATWGVYFSNVTGTAAFYALYMNSYSSANTIGSYRLPPDVSYVTSSIASGATTTVTFSPNSGLPSASTSITIKLLPAGTTSSITISSSGLIAR